jgi:hypothetical protein
LGFAVPQAVEVQKYYALQYGEHLDADHTHNFCLLTAPCTDMQELGLQGQILDLLFCIKGTAKSPSDIIVKGLNINPISHSSTN